MSVVPFPRIPWRTRLAHATAGLCPRCHGAPIFRGRFAMHSDCPACGLHFEREPGYFTGAMYISYALAVPLLLVLTGIVFWVTPQLSFEAGIGVATVLFLPAVPTIFRYSRILWIHFDQTFDPSAS